MKILIYGFAALLILAVLSLFIGVLPMNLQLLAAGDAQAWQIFWTMRLPRALAPILAGAAMALSGTIMQLLNRNRFVDASTAGTADSAALGLLCAMLLAPSLPLYGKMLCAALFAFAGTALFMLLLRHIPLRSALIVPLTGLMLGGVIRSVTDFFAYRYDMLQSLRIWTSGDFSAVMANRYELLWLIVPLTSAAYYAANRFTLAAVGKNFSTALGLHYRSMIMSGLVLVAAMTAVIAATIGQIPFLGLIIPNIIALKIGDNLRRTLPFIILFGALAALSCDILGRIILFPYEIPVSAILGIIGSAVFLYLLFSGKYRGKGGSPLA